MTTILNDIDDNDDKDDDDDDRFRLNDSTIEIEKGRTTNKGDKKKDSA